MEHIHATMLRPGLQRGVHLRAALAPVCALPGFEGDAWLRTNGVNTNGAAAKVINFDRLGKKYTLALLGR